MKGTRGPMTRGKGLVMRRSQTQRPLPSTQTTIPTTTTTTISPTKQTTTTTTTRARTNWSWGRGRVQPAPPHRPTRPPPGESRATTSTTSAITPEQRAIHQQKARFLARTASAPLPRPLPTPPSAIERALRATQLIPKPPAPPPLPAAFVHLKKTPLESEERNYKPPPPPETGAEFKVILQYFQELLASRHGRGAGEEVIPQPPSPRISSADKDKTQTCYATSSRRASVGSQPLRTREESEQQQQQQIQLESLSRSSTLVELRVNRTRSEGECEPAATPAQEKGGVLESGGNEDRED